MSATTFLRHRRAAAVKLIEQHLTGPRADAVIALLAGYNLTPEDVGNLAGNTDVLTIADDIGALILNQPELDDLEQLGVLEIGDRAAVHGVGVQSRQFEPRIQHPCQETVGTGNMHDIPSVAGEDLANVSDQQVIDAGDSMAAAATAKAEDALGNHSGLPLVAPTPLPATDQEPPVPGAGDDESGRTSDPVTQTDERVETIDTPSDPEGTQTGAVTPVDLGAAADALIEREEVVTKLEKLGEDAILAMNREQLLAYADAHQITGLEYGQRTHDATIAKQIIALQKDAE